MNKKLLPWLITFCAIGLGGTAAYYSIIGLSKLFAGAALAVIVMTSFLELSKLTLATLLHSYWKQLNKFAKIYYIIALIILSIITSMGIYGMLSEGYQDTANKDKLVTDRIEVFESKKELFIQNRENILREKQSLQDLKGTLSKNSVTQFTDKKGNLVVRSNNLNLKQIERADLSDEKLTAKLDVVNDSIFSLESTILLIKSASSTSELGPLKYLSGLTGYPMDKIINILLLVIIFVFDPLAIALVIAANFAFDQIKPSIQPEPIEPEPSIEPEPEPVIEQSPEIVINDTPPVDPVKVEEDRLLHNPSVSQWMKNKILRNRINNDEGEIKTY